MERPRRSWKDNIKLDLKEIVFHDVGQVQGED
jgi:hypothetical protein